MDATVFVAWVDGGAGAALGPGRVRTKDGTRLAFTVMFLPSITTHRELALALRSDLAQVGVGVDVTAIHQCSTA